VREPFGPVSMKGLQALAATANPVALSPQRASRAVTLSSRKPPLSPPSPPRSRSEAASAETSSYIVRTPRSHHSRVDRGTGPRGIRGLQPAHWWIRTISER
jgi:hypothetical protein